MNDDNVNPPIYFVPKGALGQGAEQVSSEPSSADNGHANNGRLSVPCDSTAGGEVPSEWSVELRQVVGIPKDYTEVVTIRSNSLLAYAMIDIYVSSMRIFIQQCLPVDSSGCIDRQIMGAFSSDEQEDLRKRLSENRRKSAVHLIDTKHFPILIGRFWGAFKKHFRLDRKRQRKQLRLIHSIRNDVCHPPMGDITNRDVRLCFRTIGDVLNCTGPPEAVPMLEEIWYRGEEQATQEWIDARHDQELRDTMDKMQATLHEVNELVMDLRSNAGKLV